MGPRRCREGQISPRADFMSPSQSAITQLGWSFHALDPGDLRLRPRVVGVVDRWIDCWPKGQITPRAGSMSPSQLAITQWGWSFHSLRGGIDPGYLRFRPRVVGDVDIWKDF